MTSTTPDNEHDPREQARRIWFVTLLGVKGLYQSQIPRMAAALAYRTIFSIIPVMAIGLLIFGSIVSDEQVEQGVRRVLNFAGVSQISAVDPIEPDSGLATGELTPDQVMDKIEDAAAPKQAQQQAQQRRDPFAGADIEQVITDLITRVNNSIRSVPTGWIALTSGLVLLYAAMSMLIEIEKAFNQLCGAPSGRGWLRRLMLYWTILTAGSLLLAATFFVGDALTGWVVSISGQNSIVGAMMAGYGASVLISTLLLLGAYLTIPNTRVHFRTALAGAFFAAILWELGKLGFTAYLRYTTNYAKFYGSVAILPLFMLWVYLTWLIVLFGMQASYALQNFSRLVESKMRTLEHGQQRDPLVTDPLVMLAVARQIQSGFETGVPRSAQSVASSTKLQTAQASKLLEALCAAGITQEVYSGDEFLGWSPTRPAPLIGLDEIIDAAHGVDGFRLSGADDLVPADIKQATLQACQGKSLADLSPAPAGPLPHQAHQPPAKA